MARARGLCLATVDRTATAPGARLLADWLSRPLATVGAINARHDAVAYLVADDQVRADVRESLAKVYDIERLLARVATGRCNARDLVHLCAIARAAARVAGRRLPTRRNGRCPPRAAGGSPCRPGSGRRVGSRDHAHPGRRSAADDSVTAAWSATASIPIWTSCAASSRMPRRGWPPTRPRGGELRSAKLKVGYNKVFGYYIEISKANGDKVPAHFIRKQTLVGAERYITPELKEYEDRALGAEDRIRAAELAIFARLRERTEARGAGAAALRGCPLPGAMSPPPWPRWRASAAGAGRCRRQPVAEPASNAATRWSRR
jgi:DNA mismatch repair protein MutS